VAVSNATVSAGASGASVTPPSASWSVSPTSFLFGALLFAFLFYITVNGDLAKWLGLLGLGTSATPAAAQNPQQLSPTAASLPNSVGLAPTSFVQGSQFT
jgi:hypothetical protein